MNPPQKILLHSLILIILIIELMALTSALSIKASTQLNYLYSGNYEPIAWPVINVTLTVNGSLTNGVIIVVSPSTESINEAFTGLLILPNNTSYYVVTGFLGSSSIYIISIEKMPNQSLINTQYSQYYGTGEKGTVRRNLSGLSNSIISVSTGNLSRTGSIKEVSKHRVIWNINYPLIVVTTMLVIISVSLISMYMRRNMKYPPECLEYGITKVVQRMRINEPGITHRELGNYIIDHIHDRQTVEEMIKLFEEGMYGRRRVDCRRFMTLIKRVLRKI